MNTSNLPIVDSPDGWTDEQLDAALGALWTAKSAPGPDRTGVTRARTAMLNEIKRADEDPPVTQRSPGRRLLSRRSALLAASVAVVAAGGLILPTIRWEGKAGNTAAADALNQAAIGAERSAAAGGDVPPGMYRYIDASGWYLTATEAGGIQLAWLRHERQQTWVPADWHAEWVTRASSDGRRQWIVGSEKEAVSHGYPAAAPYAEPDRVGECGSGDLNMCTALGSWQDPTQPWIASLPTTTDALWNRLYDDSSGSGVDHKSEMFVQATDALRSGLLPASVRATLYRAMALIDGVVIKDQATNLDGRIGMSFSISTSNQLSETIIDPRTGNFVGERSIALSAVMGVPSGSVTQYSAVRTSIVSGVDATS